MALLSSNLKKKRELQSGLNIFNPDITISKLKLSDKIDSSM